MPLAAEPQYYQAASNDASDAVPVHVLDGTNRRRRRALAAGLATLGAAAVLGLAAAAGRGSSPGGIDSSTLITSMLPPQDSAISFMADANFKTAEHPMLPDAELWGNVQRPYPTGAWWLNFALPGEPQPAVAYPYAVKAHADGPALSYSATRRMAQQKLFADIFAPDLTLTTASPAVSHYVDSYDQLSVTEAWQTEEGGLYKLLFVKGSPYATFEVTNCQLQLRPLALFSAVNGNVPVNWRKSTSTGTKFKVELSSGQTWLLFTSQPVTMEYDNMKMSMKSPFTGVLRAAVLLDDADEELLAQYAPTYPTGGKVNWSVNGDTMQIGYKWETATWKSLPSSKSHKTKPASHAAAAAATEASAPASAEDAVPLSEGPAAAAEEEAAAREQGEEVLAEVAAPPLLMLAAPHHVATFKGRPPVEEGFGGAFECIKGAMTPILGDEWKMEDELPAVEWHSAAGEGLDELQVAQILEQARLDVTTVPPVAPDPYDFGKGLGRLARIALITDQLGDQETSQLAASQLAPYLSPWLDGENNDALMYDMAWGGVVSKRGLEDEMEDFGNGWYNDHHFHYGYFIYGAAVAIKYDPSFVEKYQSQLELLVHDIANMNGDSEFFPFARHKDMYDWHSWASGLFPQSNGKSQESISEAINAYYAVHLFGLATKDDQLRDWGRVLMQMELRAGRTYWQMPSGTPIYTKAFASNKMAGVVGALDVAVNTWFGSNVEYIHAINMMPFTPITEELLHPSFVAEEYPVLAHALKQDGGVAQEWLGFLYLDQAVVDPDASWDDLQKLRIFDAGNSLTNSLYWVATRPRSGITFKQVDDDQEDQQLGGAEDTQP